ncbi:MAG TPA: thiamine phosphate synthase [Candidatus Limnocylindrales bacterium]|nr:thiamine phosphate synthase [Candidatus Limnocylindrales bacterium]
MILDPGASRGRDAISVLEAVLAGGGRLVQLREKTLPLAELFPLAEAVRQRCRQAGARFIVNDRVDLALAVDAEGLHVGQDDMPAAVARRLLRPGMILGVSTHDETQARQALRDGADYVAVGSIFPTGSKAGFQLVGPALVRKLQPEIPVPLVAIGGITEDNVGQVMEAGADSVAVISAVCGAPDPAEATRSFLRRIAAAPRRMGSQER